MLAEAEAAFPAIERAATQPAGEAGVRRVIGRRLPTFPVQKMSDAEWAAWWQDRIDVLGDLPEVALEAGMAAWIRDPEAEFMPKPGKLRELALTSRNRAAVAYERIKGAKAAAAPPAVRPYVPAEPRAEEHKADVNAMLADYRAQMAERRAALAAKEQRPPVQGRVDERGLSEAMRAVIARQQHG